MTRSRIGFIVATVLSLLAVTLAGTGMASASTDFVAQSRAAGLSAAQADALQSKVDDYLLRLAGRGTQVSPNQIDLKGAVLNVTVPGEKTPRDLVSNPALPSAAANCRPTADFLWFCAYEFENRQGDVVDMFTCGTNYYIPWISVGSWENNQTRGTQPLLYFLDGRTWRMPAAYSRQLTGVDWSPVSRIIPC